MFFFRYNLDNSMDGFYIAKAFMDKLVVHITKNFMTLPNIKAKPTQQNPLAKAQTKTLLRLY